MYRIISIINIAEKYYLLHLIMTNSTSSKSGAGILAWYRDGMNKIQMVSILNLWPKWNFIRTNFLYTFSRIQRDYFVCPPKFSMLIVKYIVHLHLNLGWNLQVHYLSFPSALLLIILLNFQTIQTIFVVTLILAFYNSEW